MKTLILLPLVLIAFLWQPVAAQEGIPASSLQLIDTALSVMDMNRRDCSMRWDVITADAHRLPLIKELFDQPFKTFSAARYHATHLRELTAENADVYFQRLMKELQLGTYKPVSFGNEKSADEIQTLLKPKGAAPGSLKMIERFTYLPLFKQYILPLIEAINAINQSRSSELRERILVEQCDSLNMVSTGTENDDIYKMKAAEMANDSLVREFFEKASLADMQQLYVYSLSLYRHYLGAVQASLNAKDILHDSIQSVTIETAYGRIAFGGPGDDVYNGDYLFILDVGGNDKYFPTATKTDAITRPVRVILDLGGNDLYSGSSYTIASGIFGCGIVIDVDGNDTYKSGSFSLGAGLFGVGILHDMKGADSYLGEVFSEGAGAFGIGLLIDNSGNDSYSVQVSGQAFGSTRGFGALCDKEGNDVYTTVSPFVDDLRYDTHYLSFTQGAGNGFRPIASGGIGVLYDAKGNDTYICDIFGQGMGFWFSLGALIDDEGEDRYQSYQYAQGSGVHFAQGILWDRKGDDAYISHGVSQGCGHDIGFGMLLDENGADSYVTESLSLGGGNANAVSIFCDERGDDAYIARQSSSTMGFSDFRRNYGMVGVFADGGGNDFYGESLRNNSTSTKSFYGVFLDTQNGSKEKQDAQDKKPEPTLVLGNTMDKLFIQASAAAAKHQYMVNPARAEMVRRYAEAIPFIARRFSRDDARERWAMEDLIPKLYQKDSAAMRKVILDSLASENYNTLGVALQAVGKCKIAQAVPQMEKLLKHEDWRIRATTAQQVGEAKMTETAKLCVSLLSDTVPMVRARAAYTIAQLLPGEVPSLLKSAMKDNNQLVRNSVAMGLKTNTPLKSQIYLDVLENNSSLRGERSLARIIASVDTTGDNTKLIQFISQRDGSVREIVYRSIIESKNNYWKNVLAQWKVLEKDEALLGLLTNTPSSITAEPKPLLPKPKKRK